MSLMVGAVAETFATEPASIRFLSSVDPMVLDQGRFVSEAIPTLGTHVRLFTGVDSLVSKEVRTDVEALLADVTLVGLLPRVDAHVLDQVSVVAETPQALCTRVQHFRFLFGFGLLVNGTGVGPVHRGAKVLRLFHRLLRMLLLVRAAAVTFAAVNALVGLLARVDPLVLSQVGLVVESFAAVETDVRLFPGVDSLMPVEAGTDRKAFPALGTLVWLIIALDRPRADQAGVLDEDLPTFNADIRDLFCLGTPMHQEGFAFLDGMHWFHGPCHRWHFLVPCFRATGLAVTGA